jgi:cobalt-precorrin 5A hydrolase
MARGKAMSQRFAIGLGARRGVDPREAADFVARVAAGFGIEPKTSALYTIDAKEDDAALRAAARLLETPIYFLPLAALLAREGDALTYSARVKDLVGVGSVAETTALAGAGAGSRLLAPRLASGGLTCAIARIGDRTT